MLSKDRALRDNNQGSAAPQTPSIPKEAKMANQVAMVKQV